MPRAGTNSKIDHWKIRAIAPGYVIHFASTTEPVVHDHEPEPHPDRVSLECDGRWVEWTPLADEGDTLVWIEPGLIRGLTYRHVKAGGVRQ